MVLWIFIASIATCLLTYSAYVVTVGDTRRFEMKAFTSISENRDTQVYRHRHLTECILAKSSTMTLFVSLSNSEYLPRYCDLFLRMSTLFSAILNGGLCSY